MLEKEAWDDLVKRDPEFADIWDIHNLLATDDSLSVVNLTDKLVELPQKKTPQAAAKGDR